MIDKIDDKTWKSGWLTFKDLGPIENGVTHKFEIASKSKSGWPPDDVLGWIEWKAGWRRYTFRPISATSVWFDFSCLTTVAEFCKIKTDERKAHWGPQGRSAT